MNREPRTERQAAPEPLDEQRDIEAIMARHRPVELARSKRDPKPVWCATCGSGDAPWPCDAARLLGVIGRRQVEGIRQLAATLAVPPDTGLDTKNYHDEMRKDRGWPTPHHMRTAAKALDTFTPARYGDVLRWFADLCDLPATDPPGLRDAAKALADEAARAVTEPRRFHKNEDFRQQALSHALTTVRTALATPASSEGLDVRYNDEAGTSSESNSIADPARPLASPKSGGSVDSRRD